MKFLPILLAVDVTKPIENFGEVLSYGGKMLAIGLGIVFLALILMWVALEIMGRVFAKMDAKMEKAPAPAAPKAVAAPAPVATDAELVAVITAAIAASSDAPTTAFRVVSFKRK